MLNLSSSVSFFGITNWQVVIEKESVSKPHPKNPKLQDFIFEKAHVNRTVLSGGSEKKSWAVLDADKLYALIETAYHDIQIPLIGVTFPSGLDGATYKIEFEHIKLGGGIVLSWWSKGPEEWRELTQWFQIMTKFLNDAIENKDK